MFVQHNRIAGVGAIMTRAVACATYPPGSFAWNQWGCGPAPAPAPASAPAPVQAIAPAPSPAPAAPAPVPVIAIDTALSQRAQAEYDARIAAQIAADQANRTAVEQARIAAEATAAAQAADAARAQMEASLQTFAPGVSSGFQSLAPSGGEVEFDASTLNVSGNSNALWLLLGAAGIGAAVVMSKRRKR